MFESFFPGKEEKHQIEAEQRQMDFVREQNTVGNASKEDTYEVIQQQQKSDLIRWQQELEDDVFNIVLSFLSLTRDDDGNLQPILDENANPIKPICNKFFIQHVVIPNMRPFQSKNLINSNYSEERLLNKLKYTHNTIALSMATYWDKYGIDYNQFDNVVRTLKNFSEDCCWRALNGWTKKTDSTILKRIESSVEQQQQQQKKPGLFGILAK